MNLGPATRQSLILRLVDHRDVLAWEEFAEIYGPLIRRYGRNKNLQEADADDLAQEVFRLVAAALGRAVYDPRRGSFRSWLLTITHNTLVNSQIAARRQARGSGDTAVAELIAKVPAPSSEEDAEFETAYRRRILAWAAQKIGREFSEMAWKIFWGAGVEGRNPKELAASLGTTVGTIYYYKSRVMSRIREIIEQVEGDSSYFLNGGIRVENALALLGRDPHEPPPEAGGGGPGAG